MKKAVMIIISFGFLCLSISSVFLALKAGATMQMLYSDKDLMLQMICFALFLFFVSFMMSAWFFRNRNIY